jgi:hypothetical protein
VLVFPYILLNLPTALPKETQRSGSGVSGSAVQEAQSEVGP